MAKTGTKARTVHKSDRPAQGAYRVAVYPGTFDPITNGHLDIIGRACKVVDKLVIGVAVNAGKGPLFTLDERVAMAREEAAKLKTSTPIEIVPFKILLMHFVRETGATMIVRGLRAVSDFEYEFQMAGMNARLDPSVETLFLMASERNQFISSRFVKEIGSLGGDISSFVPAGVLRRLQKQFSR
jgi:pantetheine-phosphate adenylyltransferase